MNTAYVSLYLSRLSNSSASYPESFFNTSTNVKAGLSGCFRVPYFSIHSAGHTLRRVLCKSSALACESFATHQRIILAHIYVFVRGVLTDILFNDEFSSDNMLTPSRLENDLCLKRSLNQKIYRF